MATWDVQDLIKEVSDMELIFGKNKTSDLIPRMKDALMAKVESLHLVTPSNYVLLMETMEKTTLPSDIKKELEYSFEKKTAAGAQGPHRLQSTPQSMTMPFNYLSKSEWDRLDGDCTTVEAAHMLIKRMKMCGLKSLKEDTKKQVTASLVVLQMRSTKTKTLPPSAEMYKLSQFVHDSFSACEVMSLHGGLSKYPPSPYDLGEDIG